MSSPQETTSTALLWTPALRRAAAWIAACPEETLSPFAGQYRPTAQVRESARQVLALTIYMLAATGGHDVEAVTADDIDRVLAERDTPGAVIDYWSQCLRAAPAADERREVSVEHRELWDEHRGLWSALDWASRPAWDDSLSINGPTIAPFPALDGPPVVRVVLDQVRPPDVSLYAEPTEDCDG